MSFPRPNPSRFQSTLPLRGATDFWRMLWRRTNFNPHSPCGERHPQHRSGRRRTEISIHTPLAGSDGTVGWLRFGRRYFNPHSPCGERRTARPCGSRVTEISIHTPLAGSDMALPYVPSLATIFQSTLPLRGATWTVPSSVLSVLFQSTLPLRGATSGMADYIAEIIFQSTLPLRGATEMPWNTFQGSENFNPHSPCGERLRCGGGNVRHALYFNPHSPCGERPGHRQMHRAHQYFNPHSPCGERLSNQQTMQLADIFQSTLPLRGATAEMRHF